MRKEMARNHLRPGWHFFIILIIIIVSVVKIEGSGHGESKRPMSADNPTIENFKSEELDEEEFTEFCELGLFERTQGRKIQKDIKVAECSVTKPEEFDIEIDGKMLFTLILIVTYGALIRALLQTFHFIPIPYTVFLMVSGVIVGKIASINTEVCRSMMEYTALARISSKVILFTFLPILIFESAFNIPVHTFQRSAVQIILVAFPGMGIVTILTSLVCQHYFQSYGWSFLQSCLFGSIISATDPVAVVALLRELGVSEVLSVMIEGESLLNDGVAILLFEIFEEKLVESQSSPDGHVEFNFIVARDIFLKFCQIALGGPAFGWLMGRITIFCMGYTFNDPPVEISATIVTAYLTYWLSEDVFKVSGVMAVVLLGITLRAERTAISPDSEGPVHHFWEILGYLANTVLFVMVGIVIGETALSEINVIDLLNLIVLYITCHVARFLMLIILFPILTRIGYGLTWQNMMVMMWGGLRGAVGICLALEVYRNEHFCTDKNKIGPKMLFQTAGIVLLTLIVNGITTKGLLRVLKLTEISTGRKEDMNNAVKRVHKIKGQGIRMFQLSPRMFEADWVMVNALCTVKNPYKAEAKKDTDFVDNPHHLEVPEPVRENTTICYNCKTLVPNEPTTEEYMNISEESRLKVIRAMKVAYKHRNSIGLMGDHALQILMADAEAAEDKPLTLIQARNFDKYTMNRGAYPWLKQTISKLERDTGKMPEPKEKWRYPSWKLVSYDWFEPAMMFLVILNMIPVLITVTSTIANCNTNYPLFIVFKYLNLFFAIIYTLEFILVITSRTLKAYLKDFWNLVDFGVLIVTFVDTALSFVVHCEEESKDHIIRTVGFARILRLSRIFRLMKPLFPTLQRLIHKKINQQLFVGFDVARGFVHGSEEVLKFLPQMIENRRVLKVIKDKMEAEKLEGTQIMAVLQQRHPGIAIALKSRHACRAVINAMSDSLQETKDEGLLDDTEVEILTRFLEQKIKRLWHSPASINPYAPHVLLSNLSWVQHNQELYDMILSSAQLVTYGFGEILCNVGDPPSGVYIIVAGMLKVAYTPTEELIEARNRYGKVPNSELCHDLTFSHSESDYFSSGFVIGEAGCLTGEPWASDIIAETSLVVFHISREVINSAIQKFNDPFDSLEGHMWRSVGMNRATGLLGQLPEYHNQPDKIQIHLQKSTVPVGVHNVFDIPPFVQEVVMIEGYATNSDTNDTYIAPFLVPPTCRRLLMIKNPVTSNRLLIIVKDDYELDEGDYGDKKT